MAAKLRDNLLSYIEAFIREQGRSPSLLEMMAAMQINPSSKSLISRNLKLLEQEQKISMRKDGRQLVITIRQNDHQSIPLLGKIAAGNLIEAISDTNPEYIELDKLLHAADFALTVAGDSMIEEGILDGDVILCKSRAIATEGEIIVALIDSNETTLKRISYRSKGVVTLIPANKNLMPKTYDPERVKVQGIYVGLLRLTH